MGRRKDYKPLKNLKLKKGGRRKELQTQILLKVKDPTLLEGPLAHSPYNGLEVQFKL